MVSRYNRFKKWLKKEEHKTARDANTHLNHEEIVVLIYMTLGVACLQVTGMLMNMYQWATLNPDFGSYHYYAPFVALCGWTGYVYVLSMKRVYKLSLLPFVPAVVGIIYGVTLTLIRWGFIEASMLKFW